MRKMIGAMGAALALFATSAAAQPFDDDGLGWGPYYNNHLSPYDGRPLGPPLSSLPPRPAIRPSIQPSRAGLSTALRSGDRGQVIATGRRIGEVRRGAPTTAASCAFKASI